MIVTSVDQHQVTIRLSVSELEYLVDCWHSMQQSQQLSEDESPELAGQDAAAVASTAMTRLLRRDAWRELRKLQFYRIVHHTMSCGGVELDPDDAEAFEQAACAMLQDAIKRLG